MSDKEINMAILNKLYEIADKVFDEGVCKRRQLHRLRFGKDE